MIVSSTGPALDNAFYKRLKRIDKRLDVRWNRNVERWLIVYVRPNGQDAAMFLVETEANQYRHPDRRDLVRLKAADMATKRVQDMLRESAEYMYSYREKQISQARENIRLMTVDDKIQLMQKFSKLAGSGKGNSAFRRIQARARGIVY